MQNTDSRIGSNVNDSTIGRALAIATSKLLFNEDKGYNLMQSYCDRMNLVEDMHI